MVQLGIQFVDTRAEVSGIPAECDVEILQEGVTASKEGLRLVGMSINTRLAIEDDDAVSKVGGHDKIVLHDESRLLCMHDEALDDTASNDTLLRIQVFGVC